MVILMLAAAGILVGISYLMLDILSGMVVTPKTPVRENSAQGELVIPIDGGEVDSMQVSANGRFLAYVERGAGLGQTTLKVAKIGEDNPVVFNQEIRGSTLAWLGSSGYLVYEDGGDIYRLDIEEGTQLNLTGAEGYDDDPIPSIDGEYILWTKSPPQAGAGEPEFWTMRSDGSEQEPLAPEADLPAWAPESIELLSRRDKTTTTEDQAGMHFIQRSRPDRSGWDFYTEGEGAVMYIWWPGQEDIYYVSQLYNEEQDEVKGVLFKVDAEDPFEQKKVASTQGLGDDDQYYVFYPSRGGQRLAYVGEKGLEVLDVEERVIDRFTALKAAVPLAWNEAMSDIFYVGTEGIYKVSLEEGQS